MQSKLHIVPGLMSMSSNSITTPNCTTITGSTAASCSPAFVYINGMSHPVQGGQEPTPYYTSYDPMLDIKAWYGRPNHECFNFTFRDLKERIVWDLEEFYNWFDKNCEYPAFAQRVYDDSWRLFFSRMEDEIEFLEWWAQPRGVFITVPYPDEWTLNNWERRNNYGYNVTAWCRDNVSGHFKVFALNAAVSIEFESEAEAVMMKLAWNDGDPRITTDIE
jgi:hypothetical protein